MKMKASDFYISKAFSHHLILLNIEQKVCFISPTYHYININNNFSLGFISEIYIHFADSPLIFLYTTCFTNLSRFHFDALWIFTTQKHTQHSSQLQRPPINKENIRTSTKPRRHIRKAQSKWISVATCLII